MLNFEGQKIVAFDHDCQRKDVKEAVDVSGGIAGYKALFSDLGVSFYRQDGRPAGEARTIL